MPNYILQIAGGRELVAKVELQELGLTVIMPTLTKYRRATKRREARQVECPVMPGYCGIISSNITARWQSILAIKEVHGFIGVGGVCEVSDAVIQQIGFMQYDPHRDQPKFAIGQTVEIIRDDAWQGTKGKVIEIGDDRCSMLTAFGILKINSDEIEKVA